MLCIPQSHSITGTSPSDCLVSYQDTHWSGVSYPTAEVLSVYSTAPTDRAKYGIKGFFYRLFFFLSFFSFSNCSPCPHILFFCFILFSNCPSHSHSFLVVFFFIFQLSSMSSHFFLLFSFLFSDCPPYSDFIFIFYFIF